MHDNDSIKKVIIGSLFWKLLERTSVQSIQFIVQIILARLLSPEEFGVIAIVMVFILLANVFVQSGFSTALVQKKDADELDFSSILYVSFVVAAISYISIFIAAPFISRFYDQPILRNVLRVLSITLFFGAFNSIQNAYVAKNMMFKKLFKSSLYAVIISGFVGVFAAIRGFGVWAIVMQQLANQLVVSFILWFTVKWRPILQYSSDRVKNLFSFGSKLLVSGLIETIYRELTTLIIGRIYNPSMIGYYNRGQQFPQLIVANINGSIQSVMLPALSLHQDNRQRVKEMMRRAIVTSSFVIFPMMVGMAVIAEPLIKLVLTDKWLPAVPFLQISCLTFSLWPIHTANLQAINAVGRSDIFLHLEVVKKTIGLVIIIITLPFGIYALALGVAISGVISTFVNALPNKIFFNYSYKEQMKDIIPSLLISLAMGVVISILSFTNISVIQLLVMQVILGFLVYVGLAKALKIESFRYLVQVFIDLSNLRKM